MTRTFTSFLCLFGILIVSELKAQSFQTIYEFTSASVCPNTSLGITTPAANVTFSNFSASNVTCSAAANVYNHYGWNTTTTLDSAEYLEYKIIAADCYRLDLDTVMVTFRNSAAGNFPAWHMRTSVDNFGSDFFIAISSNTLATDTIIFDQAQFSAMDSITIRFYITGMQASANTWRIDDVRSIGKINLVGVLPFYLDGDNDGYGTGSVVPMCSNPGGYSLVPGDCDDADSLINPGSIWYADMDGDGFGDPAVTETGCSSTLTNATLNGMDCNDTDPVLNPETRWYADTDGDLFGDDNVFELGCVSTLTNATLTAGDCNDAAATINPNTVWFEDADQDTYGNDLSTETGCVPSFLYASLFGGDCNDGEPSVYLGATEICDELDNNCDGDTDEDYTKTEYFMDADHDLYGGGSAGVFCSDPGIDYAVTGGDCDDENPNVNPGMPEISGDTIDDNCDGSLVGINELAQYKIEIHPNPGTNELQISGLIPADKKAIIELVNLQGQVQKKDNLGSKTLVLATDQLQAGVYFVRIRIGDQQNTYKWTKL